MSFIAISCCSPPAERSTAVCGTMGTGSGTAGTAGAGSGAPGVGAEERGHTTGLGAVWRKCRKCGEDMGK